MNKIIKCLFFFAMMAVTLTACRDDAELAENGAPINPENEVVGTYNGVFAVSLDGETTEYPGSLTIKAVSPYVAELHVSCPERNLDCDVAINVIKQNPNVRFYNEIPENVLGSAFAGSITPAGEAAMNFTKIERQGRKSYVFYYAFTGKR